MSNEIKATYGYIYHMVIVPRKKYMKEFQLHKEEIGKILKKCCSFNKIKLWQLTVKEDHVELIVELPKNLFRDNFMTNFQTYSTKKLLEICPELHKALKYFWYAEYWWRSYQPGTAKRNEREIRKFINKKLGEKRGCKQINNNQGGN